MPDIMDIFYSILITTQTQRLNLGHLHCRQVLYHLNHLGNPKDPGEYHYSYIKDEGTETQNCYLIAPLHTAGKWAIQAVLSNSNPDLFSL